jgi:hypothetical protein
MAQRDAMALQISEGSGCCDRLLDESESGSLSTMNDSSQEDADAATYCDVPNIAACDTRSEITYPPANA